eukprot:tig00021281_g19913.t1
MQTTLSPRGSTNRIPAKPLDEEISVLKTTRAVQKVQRARIRPYYVQVTDFDSALVGGKVIPVLPPPAPPPALQSTASPRTRNLRPATRPHGSQGAPHPPPPGIRTGGARPATSPLVDGPRWIPAYRPLRKHEHGPARSPKHSLPPLEHPPAPPAGAAAESAAAAAGGPRLPTVAEEASPQAAAAAGPPPPPAEEPPRCMTPPLWDSDEDDADGPLGPGEAEAEAEEEALLEAEGQAPGPEDLATTYIALDAEELTDEDILPLSERRRWALHRRRMRSRRRRERAEKEAREREAAERAARGEPEPEPEPEEPKPGPAGLAQPEPEKEEEAEKGAEEEEGEGAGGARWPEMVLRAPVDCWCCAVKELRAPQAARAPRPAGRRGRPGPGPGPGLAGSLTASSSAALRALAEAAPVLYLKKRPLTLLGDPAIERARIRELARREERRRAALALQCAWRAHVVKRLVAAVLRPQRAATRIQAAFRMHKMRTRVFPIMRRAWRAIRRIQVFWRARTLFWQSRAARRIQTAYKAKVAREEFEDFKDKRKKAATEIQRHVRGRLTRKAVRLQIKRETEAVIQKFMRKRWAAQEMLWKLEDHQRVLRDQALRLVENNGALETDDGAFIVADSPSAAASLAEAMMRASEARVASMSQPTAIATHEAIMSLGRSLPRAGPNAGTGSSGSLRPASAGPGSFREAAEAAALAEELGLDLAAPRGPGRGAAASGEGLAARLQPQDSAAEPEPEDPAAEAEADRGSPAAEPEPESPAAEPDRGSPAAEPEPESPAAEPDRGSPAAEPDRGAAPQEEEEEEGAAQSISPSAPDVDEQPAPRGDVLGLEDPAQEDGDAAP